MRSLYIVAAGLALVALGLVACQPPTEPTVADTGAATALPTEEPAVEPTEAPAAETPAEDPVTGNWILVSYGDAAMPTAVPEGVMVTANFANGSVSGNNGCNSYSATYTVDGQSLTIMPGISTLMACPEPQSEVEQVFMAALGEVTGFELVDGNLVLSYGEGQALVFEPGPSGLSGTSWDVISYNNGQEAVVTLVPDTAISLSFADGAVSGQACNNYNGPFTEEGEQVTIGPLATTRMMCVEEGVMEQEAAYLNALQAATTWSIDGVTLTLRDDGGAMQVVASAAQAAE